ncbi:MAG: methionine gamma-lyase family protein [Candidatus Eremiobacterota bacterium]
MIATERYLERLGQLGVSPDRIRRALEADRATAEVRQAVREQAAVNQWKVLEALQSEGLSEGHFYGTTGYGFHDTGRELLDRAVARIFGAQAARLRLQIVSGTHAISAALFGCLHPGDELVSLTGPPYDTLLPVLGHECPSPGSLGELGVTYRELDLLPDGSIDLEKVEACMRPGTRAVFLQRSRGYTWRRSVGVEELGECIRRLRRVAPEAVVIVDNCYGELVEPREPTEVGADLVAGSLIKNLGGALAPTGGYLAGSREVVERAMIRITAPGIAAEEGPTLGFNRILTQGLFLAPHIVGQALEGAVWAAWLLEREGYEASPRWDEPRTDLIQAVRLGSVDKQKAFCRGVQRAGAVDHRALPEPVMNPGYRDPILMAGGTFIQGSSIELSADGPLRPPHACYLQGGVSLAQIQLGVLRALEELDSRA